MDVAKDRRLFELLDAYLQAEKNEGAGHDDAPAAVFGRAEADYISQLEQSVPDLPETPAESAIRSKTSELLDAFLDKSGSMWTPMLDLTGAQSDGLHAGTDADDNAAAVDPVCESGGKDIDDAYFTESLARILLKQHRYGKALEIINSLYLNFPNKSIYFADQIRYLEKLIRINQKK